MKKLITLLFSAVLFFAAPAQSEIAVGVTVNFATVDTDGSETELSGDAQKATASSSEDVVIPEIFVETISEGGFVLGLSYIPARELGSKTRTDTSPTGDQETADAGDYTAKAELDNVVMLYTNVPLFYGTYLMGGIQKATLLTQENLNNGDDYEDAKLTGLSLGFGYRGSFGDSGFYKAEYVYTDFDEYSDISTSNEHKVVADTEVQSFKVSAGLAF